MVWPSKILGRRKFFLVMGQDRRGHFEVFLSAAIVEMTSNLQPWMKSFLLDIVMITDCKSHDIEELHQAFLDGPILVSSKFRWSQFVRSATPHGQSRWVADSRFEHEPCVIDKTPRNKNYHLGHLTGFLGPCKATGWWFCVRFCVSFCWYEKIASCEAELIFLTFHHHFRGKRAKMFEQEPLRRIPCPGRSWWHPNLVPEVGPCN